MVAHLVRCNKCSERSWHHNMQMVRSSKYYIFIAVYTFRYLNNDAFYSKICASENKKDDWKVLLWILKLIHAAFDCGRYLMRCLQTGCWEIFGRTTHGSLQLSNWSIRLPVRLVDLKKKPFKLKQLMEDFRMFNREGLT